MEARFEAKCWVLVDIATEEFFINESNQAPYRIVDITSRYFNKMAAPLMGRADASPLVNPSPNLPTSFWEVVKNGN
eukprot:scaffold8621_cov91-Cylindrotheca_fusiformis.AAC.2